MPLAAPLAALAGIAGSLAVMWGQFAIGWGLLLASALLLRWPRSLWSGEVGEPLSPGWRAAALVALVAVAAFFRLYRLNQPGLWGDDALNGLLAFDILDGRITSPFQVVRHSHSYFHALSDYPLAGAFWLFGADLSTLRLPGAVLGGLCAPLLYATVAPLFGTGAALVAGLFYATSPPQITHAKALIQIITGQFFQLAGLCLLVRGLANRRAVLVVASGLPLALCVYTYHSARLAPLVAFVYAAAVVWSQRSAADARPRLMACVQGLVVFAAALAPAVVGWVRHPATLLQRVDETAIWPALYASQSLWPLWDSLWRTLSIFHYLKQGPEYHWFGIASDPAVNPIIGFLLVVGLIESLRRWYEPRHLLLLVWCGVGLAPAVLSTGAPRLYRAFLATPPLYVWAAVPIARLLLTPAPRITRAVQRGVAVALLAAVPLIDFNYYFYRVYTHPTFRWFQGERIVEMARVLRSYGPGWTGYVLADNFDATHETLRFLKRAWDLQLESVASLADVLPLRTLPERGAVYLMSYGAIGAAAAIEHMYPGEQLTLRREPPPRSWWFDTSLAAPPRDIEISAGVYPVPRALAEHPNLDPPWGLEADYEMSGERVVRYEPYPFYAFLASSSPYRSNATWRGRLRIPEPGGYHLDVATNGRSTTSIDAKRLNPSALLAAGEHSFALTVRNAAQPFRLAIYWEPPGQPRELIPPQAFAPPD